MTTFIDQDLIPLSYTRVGPFGLVTGLAVTVRVENTHTGAVLLATTAVPEVVAGSGLYELEWDHKQQRNTSCRAIYTVAGKITPEYFTITYNNGGVAR